MPSLIKVHNILHKPAPSA